MSITLGDIMKYKLLASSSTLDGIKKIIMEYWYLKEAPNIFGCGNELKIGLGMLIKPNYRIVIKNKRFRFEVLQEI